MLEILNTKCNFTLDMLNLRNFFTEKNKLQHKKCNFRQTFYPTQDIFVWVCLDFLRFETLYGYYLKYYFLWTAGLALHCTELHCTALYCTAGLYYIYCTVLRSLKSRCLLINYLMEGIYRLYWWSSWFIQNNMCKVHLINHAIGASYNMEVCFFLCLFVHAYTMNNV